MSFDELKGFSDFRENLLDDQLRANIISYLDWGLLNKGAFQNVTIPASGQYGGDKATLQLVNDKRFSKGRVWGGTKNNWVWESGLYCDNQPIQISGVYVNNVFYPSSTSGTYSHYVDYTRGRIVFNNPIPVSSVVKAEYSYKTVKVTDADDVEFLRQLQTDAFSLDSVTFSSSYSGDSAILADNKVQLPAIAVEVTSAMRLSPYCLGGGQYTQTKVICHVLAETDKHAKKLSNIISIQNEKTIIGFNVNSISQNNKAPLNPNGSKTASPLTHNQLVNAYEWKKISIINMTPQDGQWLNTVYYIPVSFDAEVILNNI